MGLLDHKRTWRFRVNAPPEVCIAGFRTAFERGNVLTKGNWDIDATNRGATATYQGLGGVGQFVRAFSRTAQAIEQGALGSKVSFEIESTDNGCTQCAMWLSEHGTRFGFTNDAGVFRRHMQAVQRHLRKLDPGVEIAKD
jgi:hypothetical protein